MRRLSILLLSALLAPLAARAQALDYEFFKTRVQPVFLNKVPGHTRCVVCHSDRSNNAFLLLQGIAEAAEIRLFASGALKEAYLELIPAFEKASGHKVRLEWSSTTEIRKRVSAGEVHDLVILGDSGTEALVRDGKLVGTTRIVFAKSEIWIAVRAGAPRPDVGSASALKQALLTARSVRYSQGASGTYLVGMFQKLGVYDQVKAKASI